MKLIEKIKINKTIKEKSKDNPLYVLHDLKQYLLTHDYDIDNKITDYLLILKKINKGETKL